MVHFFLDLFFFRRSHFDGKLRAKQLTKAAVHTVFGACGISGVISLAVKCIGLFHDVFGAKLDAKTASLASFIRYLNLTSARLKFVLIQRFSPYLHTAMLLSW